MLTRWKKSNVGKIHMSKAAYLLPKNISADDANSRWEQSLALYLTFTEIWINNPKLAKQAGRRVKELVMPIAEVRQLHLHDLN